MPSQGSPSGFPFFVANLGVVNLGVVNLGVVNLNSDRHELKGILACTNLW